MAVTVTRLAWGLDSSFDALTPDEARAMRAAGVEVFFQCLWTGSEAPACREQNIINAHDAGMVACGYISVAPAINGRDHVFEAFRNLSLLAVGVMKHVAVDAEVRGLEFGAHVTSAIDALAGLGYTKLLYSNYNTGYYILGNPQAPNDWYLWNAFHDNDSDFDFAEFPYMGFTEDRVIGEQYMGNDFESGQFIDRNLFKAEFFGITDPPLKWEADPETHDWTPIEGQELTVSGQEETPVVQEEETKMDKGKIGAILGIVIVAAIAIAKIFGIDIPV